MGLKWFMVLCLPASRNSTVYTTRIMIVTAQLQRCTETKTYIRHKASWQLTLAKLVLSTLVFEGYLVVSCLQSGYRLLVRLSSITRFLLKQRSMLAKCYCQFPLAKFVFLSTSFSKATKHENPLRGFSCNGVGVRRG